MSTRRLDLTAYKLSDSDSDDDSTSKKPMPKAPVVNNDTAPASPTQNTPARATAASTAAGSFNNTISSPTLGGSSTDQLTSKPSLAQLLNKSVNMASIANDSATTASPVTTQPTTGNALDSSMNRKPTLMQLLNRDASSANLKTVGSASRIPNLATLRMADSDSDSDEQPSDREEERGAQEEVQRPSPPNVNAPEQQPPPSNPTVASLNLAFAQRTDASAKESEEVDSNVPIPDPLDATLGRMTESEGGPSAGPSTARGALTPKRTVAPIQGVAGGRGSLNASTNNVITNKASSNTLNGKSLNSTQTMDTTQNGKQKGGTAAAVTSPLYSSNLLKKQQELQQQKEEIPAAEVQQVVAGSETLHQNQSFNSVIASGNESAIEPLGVPIRTSSSKALTSESQPIEANNIDTARPCDSPCFEDFKGEELVMANHSIRPGSAVAGHRPGSTAHSHIGGNRFDDEDRSSIFGEIAQTQKDSPNKRRSVTASPQRQRGGPASVASPVRSSKATSAAANSSSTIPQSSYARGTSADGQVSKHSTTSTTRFIDPEAIAAVAAVIPHTPTSATMPEPSPEEMAAYSPHKRSISRTQQRMFHDPRLGEIVTSPIRLANPPALTLEEKKAKIERDRAERYDHFLEAREREDLTYNDKEQARYREAQALKGRSPMRFKSPLKLSPEDREAIVRRDKAALEANVQRAREEQSKPRRIVIEEQKEMEAAEHGVIQPPMRFGDTWTPPADENEIQKEAQRRAMERQTSLADGTEVPSFQRTTTNSRVHESVTIEQRKQMGNIMLTEEEFAEAQREEERKAKKRASNQNFIISYASRSQHSQQQGRGGYPPHFSKLTKAQKARMAQQNQPPSPPKPRLLPGGHVKVSERLLQPTTSIAGKKNDIVAYLEAIQIKPSWATTTPTSSRVASISAAPGNPAEGYVLDSSANPENIQQMQQSPQDQRKSHFEDASSVATTARNDSTKKKPTPRTNAAMERRAEANRAKVEKMRAEQEEAESRRLAPKRDTNLLSFERLQSSLNGTSGTMRFT